MSKALLMTIAMLVVVLLFPGCVPFLHPLFTAKDIVYDQAFLGTWVESNGLNTWTFEKDDNQGYTLTFVERGQPAVFATRLGKLSGKYFIDLYPDQPDIKNDFYKWHLVRAHSFASMDIVGDTLKVAMLDGKWLTDNLESGKVILKHEKLDSDFVITASTEELQKFVIDHLNDSVAFSNKMDLIKR
jgi:hypothetical protein